MKRKVRDEFYREVCEDAREAAIKRRVYATDEEVENRAESRRQSVTKQYRKKPVVINAYQVKQAATIETLEGVMEASPGDYIITGVQGERYPCNPDIFAQTYDPVGDVPTDYQALNDRLYRAFLDNVKDADLANDIAQLRELVSEKVRIQQLEESLSRAHALMDEVRGLILDEDYATAAFLLARDEEGVDAA